MKNFTHVVALVCMLTATACAQVKKAEPLKPEEVSRPVTVKPGTSLTVRYIANEGVLIASGDKQILVDGLHREYKPAYLFAPPEMQSVLENARPPYDKINFILVSHIHLDHFHPQSIGLYSSWQFAVGGGNRRSSFTVIFRLSSFAFLLSRPGSARR